MSNFELGKTVCLFVFLTVCCVALGTASLQSDERHVERTLERAQLDQLGTVQPVTGNGPK